MKSKLFIFKKIGKIYYGMVLFIFTFPLRFAEGAGTGGFSNSKIENPIDAKSIQDLIQIIINIFIAIGTPIAVLFLIYSGFKFVMAQGKPDALKDARTTFVWTLVGIAILLGASVLAAIIEGTITQLGSGI